MNHIGIRELFVAGLYWTNITTKLFKNKNMKCYIAGRIGEDDDKEKRIALFNYAEDLLREGGYEPVNPTRLCISRWKWLYRLVGYRLTLLYDLWLLMHCDCVYKIPGWWTSRGANIESCTSYHFRIYPLSAQYRELLDSLIAARAKDLGLTIEERPIRRRL